MSLTQLSSAKDKVFGAVLFILNCQQVIKLFKLLPFSLPSKWEVQFLAQTNPTWLKNITREGTATQPPLCLLTTTHSRAASSRSSVLLLSCHILWFLWETLDMGQMHPMDTGHCSYAYKGEQPMCHLTQRRSIC